MKTLGPSFKESDLVTFLSNEMFTKNYLGYDWFWNSDNMWYNGYLTDKEGRGYIWGYTYPKYTY